MRSMSECKVSKIKLNETKEVEEFVAAGKCDFDIHIFYNRFVIDEIDFGDFEYGSDQKN